MSRRDTILIAVLLNAGLLIVLFATSLKSNKTETEPPAITVLASNSSPIQESSSQPMQAAPAPALTSTDSVDQMIQHYVTPQVTSSMDANPNFLADLQPLGTPTPIEEPTFKPAVEPARVETSFKEVKVKKGDVLERIAKQNRVTVSDIMKTNHLTSTRLKIGQVLKIPSKESSTPVTTTAVAEAQYYTIKAGDNPWTIAVKHHMKVDELLKLNNMDEQKAKRLKAGDQIRIR